MTKIYYICVCLIVLVSCEIHHESDNYGYASYHYEEDGGVTVLKVPVIYTKVTEGGIHKLTYIPLDQALCKRDTIEYTFQPEDEQVPICLINGIPLESFLYITMKTYVINNHKYEVYKYSRNPFTIDGCTIDFWSPKFGIIISRSATWKNYEKLTSSNKAVQVELDLLIEQVFQDVEFYYNCTENVVIVPESLFSY